MGRSQTYDWISRRILRAKKIGRRTVVDVAHGMRVINSQPDASVNLKRAPAESASPQPGPPQSAKQQKNSARTARKRQKAAGRNGQLERADRAP
jgi:hypothetical protein